MDKTIHCVTRVKSIERGLYLTIFAILTIIQLLFLSNIQKISVIPFYEIMFMLISVTLIYIFIRIKVTMESLDELPSYRLRLFIELGFQPCKKRNV